jgi:hypothetical protein
MSEPWPVENLFGWVSFDAHGPVAKVFAAELAQMYAAATTTKTTTIANVDNDVVVVATAQEEEQEEAPELKIFLEAVLRDTCDTFARRVCLFRTDCR